MLEARQDPAILADCRAGGLFLHVAAFRSKRGRWGKHVGGPRPGHGEDGEPSGGGRLRERGFYP